MSLANDCVCALRLTPFSAPLPLSLPLVLPLSLSLLLPTFLYIPLCVPQVFSEAKLEICK